METLEAFCILIFASVLLVGLSQKLNIPYPIALVVGGAAIGFIPQLPIVKFDPNLILVIVLPPILSYSAFLTSFREFRKNARDIFSLALGLVVFTTVVIGVIFKLIFPEYSWALAFTFGAIVAPPDAIAVTTVLRRFSICSRLVTILEGESLINDASAIVLYKVAVTALLSGSFSLMGGGVEFLRQVAGGIILGYLFGMSLQIFSRRYLEPVLGIVISFTFPYIIYITANFLDVSGVLAIVVNGLIGARQLLRHQSSLRRVLGRVAWDIFIILLNCFVFILIGLQLSTVTAQMTTQQIVIYSGYAFVIFLAMLMVRMLWVFSKATVTYFKTAPNRRDVEIFKEAVLIGWTGIRGIVSLAIALGLPLTLSNGLPIEGRNEAIFMTFVVILMTLLIPGLTLPAVIKRLKMEHQPKHTVEKYIRGMLANAAEEKLKMMLHSKTISREEYDFLFTYFTSQHKVLEMSHESEELMQNFESARLKVIQVQRKKLLEIGNKADVDDQLLFHLESELDMVELHIARAELK